MFFTRLFQKVLIIFNFELPGVLTRFFFLPETTSTDVDDQNIISTRNKQEI